MGVKIYKNGVWIEAENEESAYKYTYISDVGKLNKIFNIYEDSFTITGMTALLLKNCPVCFGKIEMRASKSLLANKTYLVCTTDVFNSIRSAILTGVYTDYGSDDGYSYLPITVYSDDDMYSLYISLRNTTAISNRYHDIDIIINYMVCSDDFYNIDTLFDKN